MFHALKAVKFLFMAPFILAFLVVINLMTWNGSGGCSGRRWALGSPGCRVSSR